jgi:hypothetical protein
MLRVPSGAARCSSARKMSGLCKRGENSRAGAHKIQRAKASVDKEGLPQAASFSTFRKSMVAGITPPMITISTAWFWSTPLSNR